MSPRSESNHLLFEESWRANYRPYMGRVRDRDDEIPTASRRPRDKRAAILGGVM
jgi:hypothetical protein